MTAWLVAVFAQCLPVRWRVRVSRWTGGWRSGRVLVGIGGER
jgi:hypothetical protein